MSAGKIILIGADFATKPDRTAVIVARPMGCCGFKGDLFIEEIGYDDKVWELIAPQITEGAQ